MATIYEVSKLAGVSLATVSRVMNNSGKVTPKTRQKVQAAIKELGYRPNSMAQSLASKRSNSVGILIPELHGPFFGVMLSSVEAELRNAGKRVIITAGHSDEEKERDCIEFLLGSSCDALILHVYSVPHEYLIKLNQGPVPIIMLNSYIPEIADNCIMLDNEHGGYVATRSLIEHGHRELAYISGPHWKIDSFKRLAGHKRALQEFGLECNDKLVIEGDFEEASGRAAMKQLLRTGIPFTGVVCANDEMAAGAMDTARMHGLSVPNDFSVIGYDNVFFTDYLRPKLSSIGWRNGTTHVIFEPLDFISRLVALVPRPRVNLTRFHGVFAPNSKNRAWVTPASRGKRIKCQSAGETDQTPAEKRASMTWAKRLKRVFNIDIETCSECGGDVRIVASIEDSAVIKKILAHLDNTASSAATALLPDCRASPSLPVGLFD